MAECETSQASDLREIIHRKLLSVGERLAQPDSECDVQSILEIVDKIMQCVVLLDSIENVSENVFSCLIRSYDVLWSKLPKWLYAQIYCYCH